MGDLKKYDLAIAPGVNKSETVYSQKGVMGRGIITGRYVDGPGDVVWPSAP